MDNIFKLYNQMSFWRNIEHKQISATESNPHIILLVFLYKFHISHITYFSIIRNSIYSFHSVSSLVPVLRSHRWFKMHCLWNKNAEKDVKFLFIGDVNYSNDNSSNLVDHSFVYNWLYFHYSLNQNSYCTLKRSHLIV